MTVAIEIKQYKYNADELRSLYRTCTVKRTIKKTLFRLRLWNNRSINIESQSSSFTNPRETDLTLAQQRLRFTPTPNLYLCTCPSVTEGQDDDGRGDIGVEVLDTAAVDDVHASTLTDSSDFSPGTVGHAVFRFGLWNAQSVSKKSGVVREFIQELRLDFIVLNET